MEQQLADAANFGQGMAADAAALAKENAKEAGRLFALAFEELKKVDPEAVTQELLAGIEKLKAEGIPLAEAAIADLGNTMEAALEKLDGEQVEKLQKAVGNAAAAGLAHFDKVWDVLSEAVQKAIAEGRAIAAVALPAAAAAAADLYAGAADMAGDISAAAAEFAQEASCEAGRLLQLALAELAKIDAGAVSADLLAAVEKLKQEGAPIVGQAMNELEGVMEKALALINEDEIEKLQKAVGAAAAGFGGEFMKLWELLKKAVEGLIRDGKRLVQQALPEIENLAAGASAAATAAAAQAQVMANDARVAAENIYNSPEVQNMIGEGFEHLDEAWTQSRKVMDLAMKALAGITTGGCAAVCPLLRIEIFRDFSQSTSLFFSNMYQEIASSPILAWVKTLFGSIYQFFCITVPDALTSPLAAQIFTYLLIAMAIAAYISYVWFAISASQVHDASQEIRQGHEKKSWKEVSEENQYTVMVSTYIITACLSVYLPIAQYGLQIIFCDQNSFIVHEFAALGGGGSNSSSSSNITYDCGRTNPKHPEGIFDILFYVAIFLLVTFVLPLPPFLYILIQRNKPQGSPENPDVTYDVDGEMVPFDDKIYTRLVTSDPNQISCPYRSLYDGFERKWSAYKIFQMIFKMLLAIPLIVVAESQFGEQASFLQGAASLIIFAVFAAFSFVATPFVDPWNDFMDASGRITALIVSAGGLIVAITPTNPGDIHDIIGIVVMAANCINGVIMCAVMAYGLEMVRMKIKNFRGTFTFSDTVQNIEDNFAEDIVPHWDIDRECKHRIWHVFWQGMLLQKCGEDVATRLLELEQATRDSGIKNIKDHWAGESDRRIAEQRMAARQGLEGVDVYWNGMTRDGHNDSQTMFGKMYIMPYPFHCVMVYDDAADEAFIRGDKFDEFMTLNLSPDIKNRRLNRQKLRCISRSGVMINWPFSRQETETVRDGTKTVHFKDKDGNSRTRQEPNYSTVTFTCYYTNGKIQLSHNTDKPMADGFTLNMHYNDGHGEARLPKTGKMHQFRNRVANMPKSHFGCDNTFRNNAKLDQIFQKTQGTWQSMMPKLLEEHNAYRAKLIKTHEDKNRVLGDGFWYYVFNNWQLPRDALLRYLRNQESNPVLKTLPDKFPAALNFVYKRLGYVNLHPAIALWYVFWDDFWANNKDMTVMEPHQKAFNPLEGGAMCYTPMPKDKLISKLKGMDGMWGSVPTFLNKLICAKPLFNDQNIGVLYEQMEKLQKAHPGGNTNV